MAVKLDQHQLLAFAWSEGVSLKADSKLLLCSNANADSTTDLMYRNQENLYQQQQQFNQQQMIREQQQENQLIQQMREQQQRRGLDSNIILQGEPVRLNRYYDR